MKYMLKNVLERYIQKFKWYMLVNILKEEIEAMANQQQRDPRISN